MGARRFSASAQRARRRRSAAGDRPRADRRSRSTRRTSTLTCSSREQAADAGHRDEARKSLQKALDVNPSSLEAHALLAGLAYVEDKQAEFEAEVAKALRDRPEVRRGLPRRRRAGGAQLPLRRSGGAGRGARWRSIRRIRAAWPTSACICCAPATSRAPATALDASFKLDRLRRRHLEPAADDGHARQVRHRDGRRLHLADAQGRSAGAAGLRDAAGASGDEHAVEAIPVHAQRPDPDRDLPEARRLRRAQRRPARA